MAAQHSGVAEFVVDGAPRAFAFKVSVAAETLRIWLEDSVTKQQWQSRDLQVSDFVTANTAIPMAKVKDYAVRVAECLAPTSDAEKPTRSLSRAAADGARVLSVGFTIQAMAFVMALEYTFPLEAVQLNPTDLLSARVRDLEVAVAGLTNENTELKTTVETLTTKQQELLSKPVSGLVCAQFSLRSDKNRTDRLMTWTPVAGFPLDGVSLQDKDAALGVAINGVYALTIDARRGLKLLLNGKATSVVSAAPSGLLIVGEGDVLTLEKDALSGNVTGHVSVVLTRELSRDAVQAAKAAAQTGAMGNNANDDDEPVFDAYATTDDY